MTEQAEAKSEVKPGAAKLNGLFTYKVGMTQIVTDNGEMVPCTVLKYEPMTVAQVRTADKNGYTAVQVASRPKKKSHLKNVETQNLKATGMHGASMVREIRCETTEAVPGAAVSIDSLAKGDMVKATAVSKGKGFAGSVKRWNAGGGPAAHGSCFHRQPGSSGNRTWPGRIMKGKHFPGHLGDETTTVKNLKILDVYSDDGLIIVSGCVPGGKNAVVRLIKQ